MLILPFAICNYNTVVLNLYVFSFLIEIYDSFILHKQQAPKPDPRLVFTLRLLLAVDPQTLPRSSTPVLLALDLLPLYALTLSTPLLIHC